jgi:hypothetical protein
MYEYKVESLLQRYLILQLDSSNTFVCFTEMHWLINILMYHRITTEDTDETFNTQQKLLNVRNYEICKVYYLR